MLPNSQETADLVTLTEEILNRKFYFSCNDLSKLYTFPLYKESTL